MEEEAPKTYMQKRMENILAGRPIPEKKKQNGLNRVSPKRAAKLAEQEKATSKEAKQETLDQWFQKIEDLHWGKQDLDIDGYDHSEEEPIVVRCMECNEKLSRVLARSCTAHLLPKKIFKSVSTNDLNYLILGWGCGCHDKTHRIDTFSKMKIWPIAAKHINQLLPLLPYDELKFISQQFYDALENY